MKAQIAQNKEEFKNEKKEKRKTRRKKTYSLPRYEFWTFLSFEYNPHNAYKKFIITTVFFILRLIFDLKNYKIVKSFQVPI